MAAKAKRLAKKDKVVRELDDSPPRIPEVDDQGCDLNPGSLMNRRFEGHVVD